MNKIKIFEQNHEFQEIINYYEEKCDEYNKKNEMNVKMFVKMIEKFSNSNNNVLFVELLREMKYGEKQ